MDKTLRNRLYNTIVKCHQLLEEDLTQELEGTYGIYSGGGDFVGCDQFEQFEHYHERRRPPNLLKKY